MRLWQMKTIDIIQRIRLSTCLFVLTPVAPAGVENSSNRAVVATTCGIYFREEGQETCYVYETVKLNIYRK